MVRLKHRYLLVNILYPDSKIGPKAATAKPDESLPYTVQFRRPSSNQVDTRLLLKLIRDGVAELFGDYGSGMIAGSLKINYFSQATSTAIIRVSRDHYRLVWAALTFTTHLPKPVDQPCLMQVVRVSGTIKKAEEEAIRRARLSIRRAQRASGKVTMARTSAGGIAEASQKEAGEAHELLDFANGIEDADEPGDENDDSD